MPDLPADSELLLPFETQQLRGEYKEYYKAKRNNLFASIEAYPGLWRAFLDVDQLLNDEFVAMNDLRDPNLVTPALLLLNSHAQTRIAVELGFSGCPNEGISIMRNAIESALYALKMIREPSAAAVWAEKDDGPEQFEKFKDSFERKKKENLFPPGFGLEGFNNPGSTIQKAAPTLHRAR